MMTAFLFTLRAIAGTCPLAGGKAVFEARAMLYMYEATEYNDKAICDAVDMVYALTTNGKTREPFFSLYPNPAHDVVIIGLPKDAKSTSIQVTDAMGRVIIDTKDVSNLSSIELDIAKLAPGIYLVKLSSDNHIQQTEKLVIVRD